MTSLGLAGGQARHEVLDFSLHEFDGGWTRFSRNLFAVLLQAFEVAADGVVHHCSGFFERIAFRYKPRECRHCDYVTSLLSWLKNRGVLAIRHVTSPMNEFLSETVHPI